MTSQALIWIAIIIGIFIVLIFRIGRFSGIKSNTRLYLTKNSERQSQERSPAIRQAQAPAKARPEKISPETAEAMSFSGGETGQTKSLNVMFVYNGMTYDAYEVLGIPAGANRKIVEEAYREFTARHFVGGDQSVKMDLIEAAYKALSA